MGNAPRTIIHKCKRSESRTNKSFLKYSVSCGLTDLVAKQAELNSDIIHSVCVFQDEVSLINNPKNFVLRVLEICLLPYFIHMSDTYVLLFIN
jgi:hypothetical protein